jgi:hypothetical protein
MWPESQLYQLTVVVQFAADQTFESRGQNVTSSVNSLAVACLRPADCMKQLSLHTAVATVRGIGNNVSRSLL